VGKKRIPDSVGQAALADWQSEAAMAVRYLLQQIEDQHPGHSVELRIPPFGAIQCIAGLNHRRGTPPNVVEIAPENFIRICLGELSWPEAEQQGMLSVSGVLAKELTDIFPLDI
jgi:hypothetical protein